MFARTRRLTLRPPWPEDAPALAAAIGHESIARMLVRVPFPYRLTDAHAHVAEQRGATEPRFVIVTHDGATPTIVGGIGIHAQDDRHHLGYWLAPGAEGRGYATEAGRAVIDIARHALPLRRLDAWHFVDNPASGRVLTKLGFVPTGAVVERPSQGRAQPAPALSYTLDLADDRSLPMPIAA